MFKYVVFVAVLGASWAQEGGGFGGSLIATEVVGANTYHVYGKANYFMGVEVCSRNNMRLIRVNDQNKNDEVTHFIDKLTAISGPYWTLANRLFDESTWSFAIGDPVKYFNWAAGEPNNAGGNEKCIETYRNGYWNDLDCSIERFILCEPLTNS